MTDLFNNLNKLSANRAILVFRDFPQVTFTLQRFPLPGISLGTANQSSSFFDKPVYGDKLYYDDLFLEFAVSEDMQNWYEIFKWMYFIGNPIEKPDELPLTYTNATMILYSSHNNPILKVEFTDCVPTHLGELDFSETTSMTQEIYCSLMLKYQRYDVEFLPQTV